MAFVPLSYTDVGTAAVDKINAAIAQVENEGLAETAARETEAADRAAGDAALQEQITGALTASQAAMDAEAAATAAASSAASAAAAASAIAASIPATFAAQAVGLFLAARPGDMPAAFTSDLISGISGVPPNATPATGPTGTVLRIAGAAIIAPVGLRAVEVNRLYKVRAAVTRYADTTDPAGDAVRFGIAWYGADRNLLVALPQSSLVDTALMVSNGRQMWPALVSATPGAFLDGLNAPLPVVAAAPPGACYMRPFVQTFGGGVTDVEVIEFADVSDGNLINLSLDSLAGRLSRIEAALGITTASI